MNGDATRRVGVLLIAVAGACLAAGLPGLFAPEWAKAHAAQLMAVGMALPLLLLAWVEVREAVAEGVSQREQRIALTEQTLVTVAERWAKLEAPAPVIVDAKREAKALAVETFFRAGNKAGGFSEGKLAGCVGSDHGPWLRHFYMSLSGGEWLQDRGGNIGTDWNEGRTLDDLLVELRKGTLPLPPGPVPDVRPLPDSAAQRRTPQKSKAVVIQGN